MPADPGEVFFDSNTLLYLISNDLAKARCIRDILMNGGWISVQVLNEFVNVARRKHGLEIAEIRPILEDLRDILNVAPITLKIHDAGVRIIERYGLSTYDAMIVAAALDVGCGILYSEDMHDGLVVDRRLTIRNPFLTA